MTNPDSDQVPIEDIVDRLKTAQAQLAKLKKPTEKQSEKITSLSEKISDLEAEVLTHPSIVEMLKEKAHGASTIPKLVTVTGNVERVWDQEKLLELYEEVEPEHFPFKIVFQEVREESKALEAKHPDFWNEEFVPALSTKTKATKVKVL